MGAERYRTIMITLQRSDMRVKTFLGEKKGVCKGDFIHPSIYTIPFQLGNKKVILNTFTGQCIETKYDTWFDTHEVREYDDQDIEMIALVNADFLVKENFDEASRYFKILSLLRTIEQPKPGYIGYTILPTTACNARCVYCFELGIEYETMSDEIVEQTIQYIKDTHRKDSTIQLHWFGGEPLVGKLIITRICKGLKDANIQYRSNMITNGSLITEEVAKSAKDDWHLSNVQITLDGREEIYCERKRYVSFEGSPYQAVIKGIHTLLKENIRVSIRLNVDEENLEELHKLVDELENEFKEESLISIYCHSIYVDEKDTREKDDETFYQDMDELNERLNLFNKMRRLNNQSLNAKDQEPVEDANIKWDENEEEKERDEEAKKERYYDRRGFLKRYHCMVDSPMVGPVIMPNGKLSLCEHVGELPVVGTIWDTGFVEKKNYVEKNRMEMEQCLKCSFLPICTDFTGCPAKNRDCYKENLAIEKRKLSSLEDEKKLPPITILYNNKRIRIKEPTRELAEKCTALLTADYIKADSTISVEEAEALLQRTEE